MTKSPLLHLSDDSTVVLRFRGSTVTMHQSLTVQDQSDLPRPARPAAEAVALINADLPGWGLDRLTDHMQAATRAQRALHWALSGYTATDAQAWGAVEVEHAEQAQAWESIGGTVEDARRLRTSHAAALLFVQIAGVPVEHGWASLLEVCPPEFAGTGWRQGQAWVAVRDLAQAWTAVHGPDPNVLLTQTTRGRVSYFPAWVGLYAEDAEAFARTIDGLDWSSVGMCLRAGMSRDEARVHVREGKDMEAVRVLAGLGP